MGCLLVCTSLCKHCGVWCNVACLALRHPIPYLPFIQSLPVSTAQTVPYHFCPVEVGALIFCLPLICICMYMYCILIFCSSPLPHMWYSCSFPPLPSIPCSAGATPPPPSSQLSPQFVSHVVHHVGVNWYNFALHLGISSTVLDVIKVERRSLTSDCCRESLQRWLRHDRDTGGKGREVGVVMEAISKACGPVAVKRIQSSLQDSEVQPSSPTPLLQSTPDLAVLQEHVVPFTAAQWEVVADYLLVSYEKRAAIAASERGHVEVCCRELFNQWLQQLPGTGSLPRTWGKVLDVVGEAVGPEVAKQIRTRLESKEGGEKG